MDWFGPKAGQRAGQRTLMDFREIMPFGMRLACPLSAQQEAFWRSAIYGSEL